MEHINSLINIAIVVFIALSSGAILTAIKQPPIIGYIFTGIILGPSGFSLIKSRNQLDLLAELGVQILLFVIGMELNLRHFKRIWIKSTSIAILQIVVSTSLIVAISRIFDWPMSYALLLGFVISLSSTAVVVKMLENLGESQTELGQTGVGILIAQDLAVIPMLIILKNCKTMSFDSSLILKLFVSIGLISTIIFYLSRRNRISLPFSNIITKSKDLAPLFSLSICFGAAAISGIMGLSTAYGSFLAGLVIGNTHERIIMLETTHPIQSTLVMIFFLFTGLLLDVNYVIENWKNVLILLFIITFFKTSLNIALLRFFKFTWSKSFVLGAILSQLGEFAFLLASVSYNEGIIGDQRLIITVTVLSLVFSPIWIVLARRLNEAVGNSNAELSQVVSIIVGNFKSDNHAKKEEKQKVIENYNILEDNDI